MKQTIVDEKLQKWKINLFSAALAEEGIPGMIRGQNDLWLRG
jgi:hypothetical protein